jgi:hypothetical protein
MLYEFYAHATPSMFGEGDVNQAARLCSHMNAHRAISTWNMRPVEKAGGPVMNIADEIARHVAAQ